MSKVLTVFGATGKQGGSVVQTILADKKLSSEFTIRAVSRDINKPAAKELAAKGVEMADLSDADSLASAVQGSHTVFVVTNFWETMSAETEELQGRAVTNAAKAAGVQHIIFSALLNVSEASGGRLKHIVHFDSKARIAQYMRDSGVPCSFVWPGAFMDDFVQYIRKSGDDEYILALPIDGDKAQMPLFLASADMGKFVKLAIVNYPKYVGKDIFAAAGYLTPNQLMAEWSEATGKKGKYVQLPEDVFKSHMPPPAAQLIYENMLLMQDPGYFAMGELAPFLNAVDEKPTTWKEFARANQDKW
ncbi:hypothetical protein HZS61_008060 [Fusarium oxysporum f. sp. conglutinans]|uniref:NmrA-like domain-containing protein n=2 Tax=Fusarium oxysporum f. sp. conglutinans TaxID=100902 RepID=A0A8H6H020_FUSOX|nr:hypothetical protein FOXB_08125 [Fusarium oxysporum f. sp. conglutinans Fo5176]KAF6527758.1 hypothetical protein HZS61_008060 [Fusarium oxysporum f. sp. conglutinans]KAG7000929.1 NmrA-like family domain-containing protein 1 [Fusarium oxysporum f. sp. conglutinans]